MAVIAPVSTSNRTVSDEGLRHSQRSFWMVMAVGSKVAIVIHAVLAALFAGLGLWVLVAVNAGSVLCYLRAIVLLRQGRAPLAHALVSAEVMAHAIIATRLLGLDSGFQYFVFVLFPLLFMSPEPTIGKKVVRGGAFVVVFIALDATMRRLDPAFALPPAALDAMRIFNMIMTFVILALLAHAYVRVVDDAEARLRLMASTDPLTGAMNRRSLLEAAGRHVSADTPFTIVIADVDHFKAINDAYGHEYGDRVLIDIHRRLCDNVRPDDAVARWGGEEFVVLLPRASCEVARLVAERARRVIAETSFQGAAGSIHATMTFGVATRRPDETPESSIARADNALYLGKSSGRNRVEVAK